MQAYDVRMIYTVST